MMKNGTIHEGKASSCPGKRATEVVIQNEMKYFHASLTATPLGTIDAMSCYNQINCY
jgi:hypothetical protein